VHQRDKRGDDSLHAEAIWIALSLSLIAMTAGFYGIS
jgi:hypothetical protein